MLKRIIRPGNVTTAVLALVAAGGLTLASVVSMTLWRAGAAALDGPAPVELAASLHRVGLGPETLAAAGVTGAETTTLVGKASGHLDGEAFQDLKNADATVRTAERERDRLGRRVRSGTATQQEIADYQTARTSYAGAVAALDAELDALFEAAVHGMSQGKIDAIKTIRGHRAWDVPAQYLAKARAEAGWAALRDALADVRVSARLGEDPDNASVSLITAENADNADNASIVANSSITAVADSTANPPSTTASAAPSRNVNR